MTLWGWIAVGIAAAGALVLLLAVAVVARSVRRQPNDGLERESWSSLFFDGLDDFFSGPWGRF